jgi:hypothetical protein
MKGASGLAACMTVLALAGGPVAQADPTPDDYYSKRLFGYGVNYQGKMTFDEMIALGHTVCGLLDEWAAPEAVLGARQRVVATGVLDEEDARQVVIAAANPIATSTPNSCGPRSSRSSQDQRLLAMMALNSSAISSAGPAGTV